MPTGGHQLAVTREPASPRHCCCCCCPSLRLSAPASHTTLGASAYCCCCRHNLALIPSTIHVCNLSSAPGVVRLVLLSSSEWFERSRGGCCTVQTVAALGMLAAVGDGCRWVGDRGRAVASSPATLLAPGNSAEPDGQPWLYLDHSTLVQTCPSHLGAAGSQQQATYQLTPPAFCLPSHPHPQYPRLATWITLQEPFPSD